MQSFYTLIKLIMGLTGYLPEIANISSALGTSRRSDNQNSAPAHLPGYAYYFDVTAGGTLPDVKINIPLKGFGRDDLSSAQAICTWMQDHGWGRFCDGDLGIPARLSPCGNLETSHCLLSIAACLLTPNSQLDLNSFLVAQQ
jgi:hypothetical protein